METKLIKYTKKVYNLIYNYLNDKNLNESFKSGEALSYGTGWIQVYMGSIKHFDLHLNESDEKLRYKCFLFTEAIKPLLEKNNLNKNIELRFFKKRVNVVGKKYYNGGNNKYFVYYPKPLFIFNIIKADQNENCINFNTGFIDTPAKSPQTFLPGDYIIEKYYKKCIKEFKPNTRQDFWSPDYLHS